MTAIKLVLVAAALAALTLSASAQDKQKREVLIEAKFNYTLDLVYAISCENHGLIPKFELSDDALRMMKALDAALIGMNIEPGSIQKSVLKDPGIAELESTFDMITNEKTTSVSDRKRSELIEFAKQQCAMRLLAVESRGKAFSITKEFTAK